MLNQFYEMLSLTKERKAGALWRSLSISEQQNLIETERESHIESNLISHAEMTAKNSKWL
ncbi:MAG: hypothetical protein HWD58_18655 [Bacteroidota bacterium]|nr:MAG: hypothetical protein HWD58_18655 [Bacteroidota bacterium]